MKRKFLMSFVLLCLMLVSILTLAACGGDEGSNEIPKPAEPPTDETVPPKPDAEAKDGIWFKLINNDTEYEITNYYGNHKDITIPATYKDKPVTRIASEAFNRKENIETLTFESGSRLLSIGTLAFYSCENLKSIIFEGESKLNIIDNSAFSACKSLTSITVPASVTSIGERSFGNCKALEAIAFEDGSKLESIGLYAFNSCTNLKSITIPDATTIINKRAFEGCTSLKSVIFSDSAKLENIGSYAFADCTALESLEIPESVISIDESAFVKCTSLKAVSFSDKSKLENISDGVFAGCTSLKSITIPDGVTSIGGGAFSACKSLESVKISEAVTSIGEGAFTDCESLKEVHSSSIESWCKINFSGLYSNPLSLAHNLYVNEQLVTDLVIPSGLTGIKPFAFSGCYSINRLTIPESLTDISSTAFQTCRKLVEVYNLSPHLAINKGDYHNGYAGFFALAVYTALDITSKLNTTADGYIFYTDGGNNYLLGYAGADDELILPENYMGGGYDIYKYAFSDNRAITSISIPTGVNAIGLNAFENCANLKAVYISDLSSWCKIKSESSPLAYAEGLYLNDQLVKNLVIPDDITSINDYAFYGYKSLESVSFHKNLTSIDGLAFRSCINLKTVTFEEGSTIESINGFTGCTSLTAIIFQGTTEQWNTVNKANGWDDYTGEYTIQCTNGVITKSESAEA